MSKSFSFYEQVFVIHPDSTQQEHKDICKMVVDIIDKQKGEVFRVDTWGSRSIANPKAKGVSRGWYFYMLFSAPAEVILEVRRQFSIHRKVVYFHQEKLPKKEDPKQYVQKFFQHLEQTALKEQERLKLLKSRTTPVKHARS